MMSLDGGGEESNALLLRMDFEHAEVEELREWIRRQGRWGNGSCCMVLKHALQQHHATPCHRSPDSYGQC